MTKPAKALPLPAWLKKTIELAKSPAVVGITVTIASMFFAYHFYKVRNDFTLQDQLRTDVFYRAANFLDQKILDFRFILRGQRIPTERIAILAIDDKSLEQIGRWPWNRDVTGNMVDRLMTDGARALGFDIVFSEAQVDRSLTLIQKLLTKQDISAPLRMELEQDKIQSEPDMAFAKVIDKHKDKLVLGAFTEQTDFALEPYQDLCFSQAFKRTTGYKARDRETLPPQVFYEYAGKVDLDSLFQAALPPFFEEVEQKVSQEYLTKYKRATTEDLNSSEKAKYIRAKELELQGYCNRWLTSEDPTLTRWEAQWKDLVKASWSTGKLKEDLNILSSFILKNPILQKGVWTVNTTVLRDVTDHTGMFDAFLDTDGTIRRSPLMYRTGSDTSYSYVPSMALQTFMITQPSYLARLNLTLDKSSPDQAYSRSVEVFDPEKEAAVFAIPTDKRARLLINYAGPQMSFPYVPAAEILHDRTQIEIQQREYDPTTKQYKIATRLVDRKEFIKDRIFIVGATATGVYDLRVTPFEENYPGVETHANVLANLMSHNFLQVHPKEPQLMLLTLFILGVGLSLALHHRSALASLFWMLAAGALILAVDKFLLFDRNIVASTGLPLVLLGSLYATVTFYKYFTEERKKQYMKATFSKYVSPAIVDEILKDPENIELGGKKIEMSVFFSDIRGFTTISEKLDPQMLSQVLNEYLTPMTNLVFDNKGTLDKYMGDAVMAFFGAPIFYEDHAAWACRCALQSIEKLKVIQAEFASRGLPLIDIGIGVNTGDMCVGNMGSEIVRSYTVMGDSVNLGSRLEGINKEYGTRIIISEFTYEFVKNAFAAREVDWVRVKGKYKPIKIFELMAEGNVSPDRQQIIKEYTAGYNLYREKKFTEALILFQKALEISEAQKAKDPVAELYVERCQDFIAEPPPADWDGVFIMKTK